MLHTVVTFGVSSFCFLFWDSACWRKRKAGLVILQHHLLYSVGKSRLNLFIALEIQQIMGIRLWLTSNMLHHSCS